MQMSKAGVSEALAASSYRNGCVAFRYVSGSIVPATLTCEGTVRMLVMM